MVQHSTFNPYAGLFVSIVASLSLGAYLKAGHVHTICHAMWDHIVTAVLSVHNICRIPSQSPPPLLLPRSCPVPFVVVALIVVPLFLKLICSLTLSTPCGKSCHAGSYHHGRAERAQQYSPVSPLCWWFHFCKVESCLGLGIKQY